MSASPGTCSLSLDGDRKCGGMAQGRSGISLSCPDLCPAFAGNFIYFLGKTSAKAILEDASYEKLAGDMDGGDHL